MKTRVIVAVMLAAAGQRIGIAQERTPERWPDGAALLESARRPSERGEVMFEDRMGPILERGPRMLEYLTSQLETNQGVDAWELEAVGFLATQADVRAVEALERVTFGSEFNVYGLKALLRIGGPPAKAALDHIASHAMPADSALWLFRTLWTLPDVGDLEYALKTCRTIGDEDPSPAVRLMATSDGVRYLRGALGIVSAPMSDETTKRLVEIVKQGERSPFLYIPGGFAEVWALEKLIEYRKTDAVGALREYVASGGARQNATFYKLVLRTVRELGGQLTADELEALGVEYGSYWKVAGPDYLCVKASDVMWTSHRSRAEVSVPARREVKEGKK
jgi:hypothetical protein